MKPTHLFASLTSASKALVLTAAASAYLPTLRTQKRGSEGNETRDFGNRPLEHRPDISAPEQKTKTPLVTPRLSQACLAIRGNTQQPTYDIASTSNGVMRKDSGKQGAWRGTHATRSQARASCAIFKTNGMRIRSEQAIV